MTGSGLSSRLHFESCSPFRHHHELASSGILDMRATLTCRDLSIKILIYNNKVEFNWPVAYPPAGPGLQGKCFESSCVLCSAVAYCCGAVAPCAIAALLGRFLPRLGPLVHSSGPFFFQQSESKLNSLHAGVNPDLFIATKRTSIVTPRRRLATPQ